MGKQTTVTQFFRARPAESSGREDAAVDGDGVRQVGEKRPRSSIPSSSSPLAQFPSSRSGAPTSFESIFGGDVATLQAHDPSSILSWNANGLGVRLKVDRDRHAFESLIGREKPDVICVSEVRLPGARGLGRDAHNPAKCEAGPDRALVDKWLASKALSDYHCWWSLGARKYAGTCMLVKRTSLCPRSVQYTLEDETGQNGISSGPHEPDGRLILAEFASFWLLHTYSPNNGWDEAQFNRRRLWDERMLRFVTKLQQRGEKLIWIGDLNVAPEDCDLSHPEWFCKQRSKGNRTPSDPGDRGQPGCTRNERDRFRKILEAGNLIDLYRWKNPCPLPLLDRSQQQLSAPIFTWRGTPGIVRPEIGKFYGRGMRIDHALLSRALVDIFAANVEILGQGFDRQNFLGSDHSPIILRLVHEQRPREERQYDVEDTVI